MGCKRHVFFLASLDECFVMVYIRLFLCFVESIVWIVFFVAAVALIVGQYSDERDDPSLSVWNL